MPPFRSLPAIAFLVALAAAPLQAQDAGGEDGSGLAGSYLAARSAVASGDHEEAAHYFLRALERDPENTFLIGNAVFAHAALGRFPEAVEIADRLTDDINGQELIDLVRIVELFRAEEFAAARAAIEQGHGAGPFIDRLALGWISLGEGDMSRAIAAFEQLTEDGILSELAWLHMALARAAVGDFETADSILSGEAGIDISQTERVVRARAEILVQLDRRADALDLLDGYTQQVPDPSLLAMQARIGSGATSPYNFVNTARAGLSEVMFTVAQALGNEEPATLPLIYSRAAAAISPENHDAALLAGDLLFEAGQYDLAAESYATVPEDSDQYVEAQLGRADAIEEGGDIDTAIEVVTILADERTGLASVQAALGDILRRADRCTEAITAYDAALSLVDTTQPRIWFVYYTRGMCHHRQEDLVAAEADLRQALILNPEQPNVLNYLGYSLVEQRRNLDEALGMIERAVAARPDSGYIIDSLGWVYYRLGRFEDAVEPMERAAALLPTDPIINDHLGDVYWMVGRRREARFQWERALSFDPEPEEAARIRRKLDVGLDRVLEDEAATPGTD